MAANLDAVFLSTKAALGLMGPGGRVVIVSSTAGQRGEAFHGDYAATKGASSRSPSRSRSSTRPTSWSTAWRRAGWTRTCAFRPSRARGAARVEATIPLRRIPPPEDIAGPILFLCSDLARHVTGEVVNVNGGSVLCG